MAFLRFFLRSNWGLDRLWFHNLSCLVQFFAQRRVRYVLHADVGVNGQARREGRTEAAKAHLAWVSRLAAE